MARALLFRRVLCNPSDVMGTLFLSEFYQFRVISNVWKNMLFTDVGQIG